MASRAVLRVLLGHYLDANPSDIRIVPDEYGKPKIGQVGARPPSADASTLSFNLSHSSELALCAFTRIGAIGIDVEVARRPTDHIATAARVFGPDEACRLGALDAERRQREFLRLWTRHEAALKCRGMGFGTGRPYAARDQDPVGTCGSNAMWIAELGVGMNAAGALASELPPSSVRLWKAMSAGRLFQDG